MATDVMMPQMGESIFEGTVTKWLKKPGEVVERDEPLFEISTDKVDAEIPSPVAGTLTEIKVEAGATVQVNAVVAVIGESTNGVAAVEAKADSIPAEPEKTSGTGAPDRSGEDAGGSVTEVAMPQMGESIFEGTITKWLKKVGDRVERDEPLFEISTDKVDAEIPAPGGWRVAGDPGRSGRHGASKQHCCFDWSGCSCGCGGRASPEPGEGCPRAHAGSRANRE